MPQLKWFSCLGAFFKFYLFFFFNWIVPNIFFIYFQVYLELILEGSAGTILRSVCNYMRA